MFRSFCLFVAAASFLGSPVVCGQEVYSDEEIFILSFLTESEFEAFSLPVEAFVAPITESEALAIEHRVELDQDPDVSSALSGPGNVLTCLALETALAQARAQALATLVKIALEETKQTMVEQEIADLNAELAQIRVALQGELSPEERAQKQQEFFDTVKAIADAKAKLAEIKRGILVLEKEWDERELYALQLELVLWMQCWNIIPVEFVPLPLPTPDPMFP